MPPSTGLAFKNVSKCDVMPDAERLKLPQRNLIQLALSLFVVSVSFVRVIQNLLDTGQSTLYTRDFNFRYNKWMGFACYSFKKATR